MRGSQKMHHINLGPTAACFFAPLRMRPREIGLKMKQESVLDIKQMLIACRVRFAQGEGGSCDA